MDLTVDRRLILAGLAAVALPRQAWAEEAQRWSDYERRLRARIADGGGGRFDAGFAAEFLPLSNALRASEGAPPLQDDAELTSAARAHAADMAQRKFFDHASPEGFRANDRAGLLVRRMMGSFGENIAFQTAYNRKVTPKTSFELWKNSPGHRENLLEAKFTHVGHAALLAGATWYSVAVFGGKDAVLPAPLPIRVTGAELNAALREAQPSIPSYMLSEPAGPPRRPSYPTPGLGPTVEAGVWRVRPTIAIGPMRLAVLWGPIFFA